MGHTRDPFLCSFLQARSIEDPSLASTQTDRRLDAGMCSARLLVELAQVGRLLGLGMPFLIPFAPPTGPGCLPCKCNWPAARRWWCSVQYVLLPFTAADRQAKLPPCWVAGWCYARPKHAELSCARVQSSTEGKRACMEASKQQDLMAAARGCPLLTDPQLRTTVSS